MKSIFFSGPLFVGLALATTGFVAPSSAAPVSLPTLPGPTYPYLGNVQNSYYATPGQLIGSYVNPFIGQDISVSGSGFSSASTRVVIDLNAPSLSVFGNVSSPVGADALTDANAILRYDFEVFGPANGLVPVLINASGSISESITGYKANAGALTSYLAIDGDSPLLFEEIVGPSLLPADGTFSDSFTVNQTYNLEANVVYTVTMQVEEYSDVGSGVEYSGSGVLEATVDPTFTIAPSFANDYTLVFSPGVGNGLASGVPELSTWAMMLIGFAGLGFAGYRQSKKCPTAFA
jgi:hypothetical protein